HQDGEGGDAHADAHEKSEGGKGSAAVSERRIKEERQSDPEQIGNDDARVTDHDRGLHLSFELGNIELHPDREHEEANADLTQQAERFEGGSGEEKAKRLRRDPAEERWTEKDSGHHLSDHRRLSDAGEEASEDR